MTKAIGVAPDVKRSERKFLEPTSKHSSFFVQVVLSNTFVLDVSVVQSMIRNLASRLLTVVD